jgi:hypothetical protein
MSFERVKMSFENIAPKPDHSEALTITVLKMKKSEWLLVRRDLCRSLRPDFRGNPSVPFFEAKLKK